MEINIFKRSNKISRSPTGKKQKEEERNQNKVRDKEEEGAHITEKWTYYRRIVTLLKEIKKEMKAMRNEIKEMKKKQ